MGMQAKRIQLTDATLAAGGQSNVILTVPDEPREAVNFHNIWAGFTVEPETAGANAQGIWVLYKIPLSTTPIPSISVANLNLEVFNFDIIACGVWGASNETPFTMEPIHPETSRTLNAGERLLLSVDVTGLTTGNASIISILCAHTTRK